MKNQQKIWQFIKEAHIWEKRMFQLNFSKKLITSPIFLDEVFQPFEPDIENVANADDEPAMPANSEPISHVQSQENQSDEEPILESISPAKKTKSASMSRKKKMPEWVPESEDEATPSPYKMATGKEKMPKYQESAPATNVSPFSPLAKKRKTISAKKGGNVKMTAAEIRHYYSSSEEEQVSELTATEFGGSRAEETLQALFDAMEAHGESEDSDVAFTKEVRTCSTHTMKRMAQAGKRRPGLHQTT